MAPKPDTMSANSASGKDNPSFTNDAMKPNGTNSKNGHNVWHTGDGKHVERNGNGVIAVAPVTHGAKVAEIEDDVRCGYGSCKPDWLQVFNNPKMFLLILCWFSFIQGFTVNGINNVNTGSIERRFKLKSSQVGLISSAYDISAGIFILPVTYFGTYAHQPRLITIAAFVMACGSMVMALPHVFSENYEFRSGASDVCSIADNGTDTLCASQAPSSLSNYLYLFMFGQFLHGFGGTVLYSLGIVFIDANVRTKDSPMYQGLMYSAAALGPAVGYLLGGYLLDTFVDFDTIDVSTLTITPNDVQWIGAWWIGFVIASCLMFTTVVFCFMPYARELPSAKKVAQYRVSQAHQNGSEKIALRDNFGKSLRDLPTSLLLLLKNPVLMAVTAAAVTEGIITSGFATFLPKFIQNQYGKTASTAAILTGLVAVPGAAGGNVMGGLITKCFNLKVRGMLLLNIVWCLLALAISGIFFAKCPVTVIAGVSVPYGSTKFEDLKAINLDSPCNARCSCSTASYDPVCGEDGVQYFSPCHAGCNASRFEDGLFKFSNCSCVLPTAPSLDATQRVCEAATCSLINVFLPLFFCLIFFTFMAGVPTVSVTLRCIPDIQRSFGLGVQWLFIRFLGTVVGPILFGFVFDKTCLLWQEKCGESGSCWIYDNHQLSINLAVLGMIVKACSAFFFFLAYILYKPPAEETPSTEKGVKAAGAATAPHPNAVGIQNEAFSADVSDTIDNDRYIGPAPRSISTAL